MYQRDSYPNQINMEAISPGDLVISLGWYNLKEV